MSLKFLVLLVLPSLAAFACVESDCTRTATCPRDEPDGGERATSADSDPEGPALDAGPFDGGGRSNDADAIPGDEPVLSIDDLPSIGIDAPADAGIDAGSTAPEDDARDASSSTDDSAMSRVDGGANDISIDVPEREVDDAGNGCTLGETRPCVDALGACAEGEEVCGEDGVFGPCNVQPQLVDSCTEPGDDSNCDGLANDGCECTGSDERACGPSVEQGICVQGTSACDGGVWGPCEGAVYAAPRQCGSSEDNDCDGNPDDTRDGVCQCAEGESKPCDQHPGFDGVGPCVAGVSQCVVAENSSSAEWGECVGAVGPLAGDLCDVGDDSNCNGIPNQGCDFTPPAISSSSPEDGDTGVFADTAFTIVFNEPMDRDATEAAVQLSPAGTLEFSWNAAGTVLTIVPSDPLEYAEGEFDDIASLAANEYVITVGVEATDVAGNALLAPFQAEFSTLRRIEQTVPLVDPEGAYLIVRFSSTSENLWPCQDGVTWVGYQSSYAFALTIFDVSVLPEGISQVESATMLAEQAETFGNPFPIAGPVEVEHISVPTAPYGSDTVEAETLRVLGVLSNSVNVGPKALDVTVALEEDYQLRAQRDQESEYRLVVDFFEPFPTTGDHVTFTCSEFKIETTYLLP